MARDDHTAEFFVSEVFNAAWAEIRVFRLHAQPRLDERELPTETNVESGHVSKKKWNLC